MIRILFSSWIVAVLLFAGGIATATWAEDEAPAPEERVITCEVDGLACPFCAFGLEKKIKKLSGVKKLDILMKEGQVKIHAESDADISKKDVEKAVKDSGFELKAYKDSKDEKSEQ